MKNTGHRLFTFSARALAKKKVSKKEAVVEKFFGRPSSHLSAGIVGLANVGKSTFFQAITKTEAGNAANYPFATIDPEELLITIPSERLNVLQKIYGSKKQIRGTLSICDIAGLTRGASQGKGLGNQFLNDIRQVDGIYQVVRGFQDSEITHIENNVDPVRDLEIVNEELMLKDLDFIEHGLENANRQLRHNKSPLEKRLYENEVKALTLAQECLLEGTRVISYKKWTNDDIEALNKHNLLTAKPVTYLLNVNEQDYVDQKNEFLEPVQQWINEHSPGDNLIIFSADVESRISKAESQLPSCVPKIIEAMKTNLNLISFFTCGEMEAREWPLRKNSTAPQAAGIIHSDLQKTFVSAEVLKYDDVKDLGADFQLSKLKAQGKVRKEGKSYVIQDGDIILIKATSGKAR